MTVKHLQKQNDFYVCTWNVHSLVENSGDIRTCQRHCVVSEQLCDSVDKKLDLLVGELQHFKVAVAGIQEIKWLGLMCGQLLMGIQCCTLAGQFLLVLMLLLEERV